LKLLECLTRRSDDAAAVVPSKLGSTLVKWLQWLHLPGAELPDTVSAITQLLCNICSHPTATTELIEANVLHSLWTNGAPSLEVFKIVLSAGRCSMDQPLLEHLHQRGCCSSLLQPYTTGITSADGADAAGLAISCLVLCIERSLGKAPSLVKQFHQAKGYESLKRVLVLMTKALERADQLVRGILHTV
jgi:hypothetical protein